VLRRCAPRNDIRDVICYTLFFPDYTEIGAEVKEKILGYLQDANSYMPDSLIVKAELAGGVKDGEDAFRRHVDLDIVDIIEDVATSPEAAGAQAGGCTGEDHTTFG